MDRKQVASILDEIGTLMELKGENPFKCSAYHNAARVISGLQQDLKTLVGSGQLSKVKGIGEALSKKITEIVTTGKSAYLDELRQSFPDGLLAILQLPGLGPKKVKALYEKLGVSSVAELEYACTENRLIELEGFGQKSQEKILKAIEHYKKTSDMFLYSFASEHAESLMNQMRDLKAVMRVSVVGSLRRRNEIVKDIDLLVSTREIDRDKVVRVFPSLADVEEVVSSTAAAVHVILRSGIHAELTLVDDEQFPYALHYVTGSKKYLEDVKRWGIERKMEISEHGIFKNGKLLLCKSEQEIFGHLGLQYIPPELREGNGEIELAAKRKIPELVEERDIKGTFHCHTNYSDGVNTIEEMAAAARRLGFEYLGIADHSKSAFYANGLSEEKIKHQHREINELNGALAPKDFKILKGIECDILPDGNLDYSDKVLSSFDYVVVSVHSKFKMTEEEATNRIVKAISHKHVTMLGHPTGRLLLGREGYPVNMKKVIDAAAERRVIIELNAHPYRLDIDWRWMRCAKEKGVNIAINPDAHRADDIKDVFYGLGTARKGWLTKEDVVNTRDAAEVSRLLNDRRKE